MAEVEPADVSSLLDRQQPPVQQAITNITLMARAYTRGNGFNTDGEPNDEIAAVITLAAARLAANAPQLLSTVTVGHRTRTYSSSFQGWTLAERLVLDRYRRKAM